MKPTLYIETTIPSYLTAWRSRDLVTTARQQITREWWQNRRVDFDLFTSQLVIDEVSVGDPDTAIRRLEALSDIPLLEPSNFVGEIAQALIKNVPLPSRASDDAIHIAISIDSGIDYLLTWNCTHIANATLRGPIERVCTNRGYIATIICTPEELLTEE